MIWLIGAKGMLGTELSGKLKEAGLPFFGTDLDVSILEPDQLEAKFQEENPSWIINCSAYTAVDRAEDEKEAAFRINRDGVENIARLAAEKNVPIIHISTDYVFDGTSKSPLNEDAPTGPDSVYGESKLAGEEALRALCPEHIIIRTAWLYGQHGPNFVYTMIKLMNAKEEIKVVNDQYGSPSWTGDLAAAVVTILGAETPQWGTYHFSGEGETTWYGFAREIYKKGREAGLITSECKVSPCTTDEFPSKAKRPAYSLLSKEKIKTVFGVSVPEWEESLEKFFE